MNNTGHEHKFKTGKNLPPKYVLIYSMFCSTVVNNCDSYEQYQLEGICMFRKLFFYLFKYCITAGHIKRCRYLLLLAFHR
jgi:hypothetical protein